MNKVKLKIGRLKLVFLAMLFWTMLLPSELAAKTVHLDSVKLHIPFYGNLNDWSGWNNNGVVDTLHFITDRNGAPQRAFRLNESNPNLRFRAKFLNTNTYSLMFWYRFPQGLSDTMNWMQLGDGNCKQQLLAAPHGTDSLHVVFKSDSMQVQRSFGFYIPFEQNKWNHITWMKSADSVYAFYNAFFRFEAKLPFQVCADADSLVIGKTDQYAAQAMDIDELRWYSENIEPSIMLSLYVGERSSVGEQEEVKHRIYPNPVLDVVHYESPFQLNSVQLYDMQGRLVQDWNSPSEAGIINLKELPQGNYILHFLGKEGQYSNRQIQKQ
ncbi:MAG: T9SS type A sorting domain-containing protein [Bacteroidetes bacterium]|nr:MAG: T9SS type A sorting domain-containing protein [Bacteroidota bacterium]